MMKRYKEDYNLDMETLENLCTYMDDDKREQVHFELAPCAPETFLRRYLDLDDPDFEAILYNEFGIEIE